MAKYHRVYLGTAVSTRCMYEWIKIVNFCVSGVAIDWYWGKGSNHWYTPMRRLITKNWGSVAAGSFLNAFLELPTLIVELLTCHKNTCCNRAGECCENSCFCFDYVFNLVRTDVYSYINLSGIPYCNSARECTKICHFNEQFVGNYNPIKHIRFIALVFAVAISSLFGFIFANIRLNSITFWHVAFIIVVVYSIVCWFINICADGAESISTSFFVEHFQSHDYEFMQKALPVNSLLFSLLENKLSTEARRFTKMALSEMI
jgi:hypothetical protein